MYRQQTKKSECLSAPLKINAKQEIALKKHRMKEQKYIWKKEYSFVLLANVIYIIAFYLITNYLNA
jgi:hypothetical protein